MITSMTPQFTAYHPDSVADMAASVELLNRLKPHRASTVEETRGRLAQETRFQLYLARTDTGDVAATLELATSDLDLEPMLWLAALVNPDAAAPQQLLEQVATIARSWAPNEASGATRPVVVENDADQLAWWTAQGFVESERLLQVELDLTPATLPAACDRTDLRIVTIAERPDLLEVAYRLYREGKADAPGDGAFDQPTFDRWRSDNVTLGLQSEHELVLLRSSSDHAAEIPVGYASLIARKARPGVIRHGLTTIAREARGERLACEFKSLLLHRAYELGFTRIGTSNEVTNIPMRRVNDAMGFEPMPAMLILRGKLT
ncbi:MAG: hypothetical protein H7123_02250 [Thermoleophilia bacterium]|nr:hypothetical protein [Thermoleophilia bacterium]